MIGRSTPSSEEERDEFFDDGLDDDCPRCGGEGWIMAGDGDPSDWGEDTYCGSMDDAITCRECRGTGVRK